MSDESSAYKYKAFIIVYKTSETYKVRRFTYKYRYN